MGSVQQGLSVRVFKSGSEYSRRDHLPKAISELRLIGGSGIIVSPITYIFEEEPPRYKAMLAALNK